MQNNFLMGVIFWRSWGVAPGIFKNTNEERVFEKMVANSSVLEGVPNFRDDSFFGSSQNL